MANGRGNRKKASGRDPGGFVALPWAVMDSQAYQRLSHPARAMLMEVGRQYHGDDNGRMLLSRKHLEPRGWKSADVIQRAKAELLEAGFIYQTVQGMRPNKASWFAATWWALDHLDGFDAGAAAAFERRAYDKKKNAPLVPSHGTARPPIAPSHGTRTARTVPSDGPMAADFDRSPVPSDGHPLEKPSAGVGAEAVGLHGQHTRSPGGEAVGSTSRLVAGLLERVRG